MAQALLGSYPAREVHDPMQFALGLATAFVEHPIEAGRRVIDPLRGLPGTNKFFPTISEVVEALKKQTSIVETLFGERKPSGEREPRLIPERTTRKPFMPYPALWDALGGEPELLKVLKAMDFDGMTATSKLMATEGIEAAKAKLRAFADMPYRQKERAA
jgi:hypothetical protein